MYPLENSTFEKNWHPRKEMNFFKSTKPPPTPGHKASPSTQPAGPDLRFEPLPLPEVVESDSDTSWALWQDSVNPHEEEAASYKDTEPMGLMEDLPTQKPQGQS